MPLTIQSMEFSRPEYWSGWPFPSPGDLPNPRDQTQVPHCRRILYQLSHTGSPRIREWVASPFSSGSSWPRNQTGDSWIAGRFFPSWATGEAQLNKAWRVYSTEYFVALWLEKFRWGSTSHSDMERVLPKYNIREKTQEQKTCTSRCILATKKGMMNLPLFIFSICIQSIQL